MTKRVTFIWFLFSLLFLCQIGTAEAYRWRSIVSRFQISSFLLLLISCLLFSSTSLAVTTVKDWSFDSSAMSWTTGGTATSINWYNGDGWPGIVYSDCTGNDPYFVSPSFSLSSANWHKVKVNIDTHGGSTHQLRVYWKRSGDSGFDESRSQYVNYSASTGLNFIPVEVDVGSHSLWTGTITQIRIDPSSSNCTGVRFHIDYIRIQGTPPPPDLTISSVSFTNTVRRTDDPESISVTVDRTNGQLTAGTYVLVRVYASSDTNITTSDTYLGEFSSTDFPSNTLNSSGSLTRSKQFNMPSTCGYYYLGAIADPTNYHAESNEGNNSRAGNQMVVGKITVTNPNSSGITWYKSSQQTVTWTSCSNVTGNVQIQFYQGGSPSENITGSTSNDGSHPFTVSNSLQDGSDYKVGISAMSGQIWDFSDNDFTIIDEPPPAVPSNVNATQISNGIRISWNSVSGVGGATPYMIYWGTDASVDENNKSGIFTTDQTIYDHGGLDSGIIYYYRVKACNNINCSELSNITSAQAPLADLTISLSSIPANANAQQGSSYPITCTVSRTGGLLRPTTGYVRVFVYMNQSTDPGTATSEHLVLGDAGASSFDFPNTALDDGSETQSINVPIPAIIEGPFYIHVKVDGSGYWVESNENNNGDSSQQNEELIVWRPGVPLPDEQMGVLARTWNNPDVYWIKYGKKWPLLDWDTVLNLDYTAADVEWYGSGALDGFTAGKTILHDNDLFCYRSATDSTVYVIENGESHPFFQWDNFLGQGFTEEDIYWAKPEGAMWIQSIYPEVDAPMIRVEPSSIIY